MTTTTLPAADLAELRRLHDEIGRLQAELADVNRQIAEREADALGLDDAVAEASSLSLVQRCLDDMLRTVRDDVRGSIEEPAQWAAAERLRTAQREAEALRRGDAPVPDDGGFEAFWEEQVAVAEARSEALAGWAPVGAALLPIVVVAAWLVGALHLL